MSAPLLLFDLDGTLLRSDKTVSPKTLEALENARRKGALLGISTSRGEGNIRSFLQLLSPEAVISSGGALVRFRGETVFSAAFSPAETREILGIIRSVCGEDCELAVDSPDRHYWNFRTDPHDADPTWGETEYCDFSAFSDSALKICADIPDAARAEALIPLLPMCDSARFSDGHWYKFTAKTGTKANALRILEARCGIPLSSITAFGDDWADIGMLALCGTGIAMGNAIPEVKAAADLVIGSNDEDGIARYLESLTEFPSR